MPDKHASSVGRKREPNLEMTIAEAAIKLCDRSNGEFQKSDFTNIPCSTFIMRDLSFQGIVDST